MGGFRPHIMQISLQYSVNSENRFKCIFIFFVKQHHNFSHLSSVAVDRTRCSAQYIIALHPD